jgi:hypothetical protein|tara:strand:+ start:2162 stop:2557 length:396 start_codon:yes stop_codon:yes gene_type:complete
VRFDTLDDGNFLLFAAKAYENPSCVDDAEFQEDLNRIKYIKRLLRKYEVGGELKERLILNHLVVLYNVFDGDAMTRMLFYRLYEYLEFIKPFMDLIGRLPNVVYGVGPEGIDIDCNVVVSDPTIEAILSKI